MIFLKICVIISFLSMLYINYLAATKPLNGISTGDISNKYKTLFTPKGFTFSIWGLIYILLLIFVIVFVSSSKDKLPNMELLGILFIISSLLNIAWLFSWHYDHILLSTIIMIIFLVVLLSILVYTKPTGITYATFSVYASWVSVALIANISVLIFKYDISFFMNKETLWFYITLCISLIIGLYMVIIQKNYFYGGVFLWAYFGIAMKYVK